MDLMMIPKQQKLVSWKKQSIVVLPRVIIVTLKFPFCNIFFTFTKHRSFINIFLCITLYLPSIRRWKNKNDLKMTKSKSRNDFATSLRLVEKIHLRILLS